MPRTLLASDHGFAMPAEWSPHAATWMGWPCDDELWVGELEPVRREFAELVRTIAAYEPVELLVRDAEALRQIERALNERHKSLMTLYRSA